MFLTLDSFIYPNAKYNDHLNIKDITNFSIQYLNKGL
jgi:hypothetical protein